MACDQVQGERGLLVVVEIGPIHGHQRRLPPGELVRHPTRETVPHVDAVVAQHPIDLIDRVLGHQSLCEGERLPDQSRPRASRIA